MTTKNITVTVCFDVDLFEYNRYFKVRKTDGEVIAIYDLICTQSDRLNEQGKPENIRISFPEEEESKNA